MKNIYILLLITIPSICFSQNFSQREISKLYSLEVDLDKVDFNNQKDYMNLSTILEKDKKWKLNKIIGIAFVTFSALSLVVGVANSVEELNSGGRIFEAIKYYAITGAFVGISVPLFISSKRRKKETHLLIKLIGN